MIKLLIIHSIKKGNLEIFKKVASLSRINLNKAFTRNRSYGSIVQYAGTDLEMIKALISHGVSVNSTVTVGGINYPLPLYLFKQRDPELTSYLKTSLHLFTLKSMQESLNTAINDNLLADLVPIIQEMINIK